MELRFSTDPIPLAVFETVFPPNRTAANGAAPPNQVAYHEKTGTDKLIDGRDGAGRDIVFTALVQSLAELGFQEELTEAAVFARAWPHWQASLAIDVPGKPVRGEAACRQKCAYAVARYHDGRFVFKSPVEAARLWRRARGRLARGLACFDDATGAIRPTASARPGRRRLPFIKFDDAKLPTTSNTFVQGLLTFGGFSALYGAPGCGKSFFASDLGLHVALGWEWNGLRVQQGTVLYVAAEGGFGFRQRLEALKRQYGVRSADFYFLPDRIDLRDPDDGFAEMIEDLNSYDPQLIIFDTLNRTFGIGDENSARDMSEYVANIDRICAETGTHCMVIHHSGKDLTRGSRGHSALPGALDLSIETKQHGSLKTATIVKNRDGKEGAVYAYTLKEMHLGLNEFNDAITSCCVEYKDEDECSLANGNKTRRRPALSGQANILMRVIENLVASDGETPPASNHIPSTVKAVPLSLLRRTAKMAALTPSDNSNTQSHAFNRALTKLRNAGRVAVWHDWVWLVKEGA